VRTYHPRIIREATAITKYPENINKKHGYKFSKTYGTGYFTTFRTPEMTYTGYSPHQIIANWRSPP
jgi:hypothetical protein